MIRGVIAIINERIAEQLDTDAVQVAGIALPFYDQQDKADGLRLADAPKRLVMDSSVRWQSAHLVDGSRVVKTQTWGSFSDNGYEVRFVLIGLSKSKSGLDVAMRALDGVGYVVIDGYENDTLTVLNRYWRVKTGPDKNYDPDVCAFAVRYHIEGVCDEDFAELPDAADLAALPVLLAEPEVIVVSTPGTDTVARTYRHIQALPASLWTIPHNMGCYPAGLLVEDSGGNDWHGDVTYVDTNTLTINFGTASFAGTAYLS